MTIGLFSFLVTSCENFVLCEMYLWKFSSSATTLVPLPSISSLLLHCSECSSLVTYCIGENFLPWCHIARKVPSLWTCDTWLLCFLSFDPVSLYRSFQKLGLLQHVPSWLLPWLITRPKMLSLRNIIRCLTSCDILCPCKSSFNMPRLFFLIASRKDLSFYGVLHEVIHVIHHIRRS